MSAKDILSQYEPVFLRHTAFALEIDKCSSHLSQRGDYWMAAFDDCEQFQKAFGISSMRSRLRQEVFMGRIVKVLTGAI
jgi:hypothetical protein